MKRMPARIFLISLLLTAITGCDSFNLLDMFEAGDGGSRQNQTAAGLSLLAQKDHIHQNESVTLYPSGGTAPYTFAVLAVDLYYSAGNDIGYVSSETYTAQKAVGTVKIRVTDALGSSAETTIAVLPLPPDNFAAATGTGAGHTINLSWTYADANYIGGYRIVSSTDGSSFTGVSTPPASTFAFTDTSLNQTKTYYYKVYAVAGSYESTATPVQSAVPN